jgi:hypothetical protein
VAAGSRSAPVAPGGPADVEVVRWFGRRLDQADHGKYGSADGEADKKGDGPGIHFRATLLAAKLVVSASCLISLARSMRSVVAAVLTWRLAIA